MKSGIYQIKNKADNKKYIGKSKNVHVRLKTHMKALKNNNHYNVHLQNAYNKYGEVNFDFSVLALLPEKDLDIQEICAIYLFETDNPLFGYNLTLGGEGINYSLLTEETKKIRNKKVSDALMGKKYDEKRKQQNWFHEGMRGKKHSEESKNKMSENRKGKPAWNKGLTKETDERVANQANAPCSTRFKKGQIPWNSRELIK